MSDKTDKKKKGSEPGYAEANAELQRILEEIESGAIDLDVLSDKVERAAALLQVCRDKLAATELKVKKVVDDLADFEAGAATPGADEDDDEER